MPSIQSRIASLSIRTKIALGAGVIALVSWVLLAAFSYAASGVMLAAASKQMFEAAADYVAAEFKGTYEPVERVTSVLAYSHLAEVRTEAERLAQVPIMVDVLRRIPAAAAIQIGDEQGNYFIVRRVNDWLGKLFEAPKGSAFEADLIDAGSRTHRRWFYDDKLSLLAVRDLPASNYDPRTRPWYTGALYTPDTFRTSPYVFFFMSEIGLTVARAKQDRRAVIAADVTLASLSRTLAEHRVTPSAETVVHDTSGVLAWSGKTQALVQEGDTVRRRKIAELGHPGLAVAAAGAPPAGWLVHRAQLGFSQEATAELIIVVPEGELLADLRARRTKMLAISFVVLALVIPLA